MADPKDIGRVGGDVGNFAANLKKAADSVIPTMSNLKNIVQGIVGNLNAVGAAKYPGMDNTNKVAQGAPPIGPRMENGQFNNNGGGNRIAVSAAGAAYAAQAIASALPGTNQLVQQDLLTNRAMAMGFGGGNYNNVTNMQNQMNRMGTVTDQMDATRALSYAKAAGLAAPNFMGGSNSVMGGVAQMSNITPGLGLTGGLQAYGALQQGRSVNNLLGIGIRVRNQDGSMVGFNEIVDQLWTKINREKIGSAPISSSDLDIMLEPGNSLARLLDFYFGNDAGLRASIQTAMYIKAENNGRALGTISKTTLKNEGFTTKGVLSLSERTTRAARVSALSAPAAVTGFTASNDAASALSRLAVAATPLIDVFTGLSKAVSGISGIGNGLGGKLLSIAAGAGIGFEVGGPFGAVVGGGLGLFGGGKAAGGPVNNTVPYVVGEKGPELFVPSTSGTIIPNSDLKGMFRDTGGGTSSYGYQGGKKALTDEQLMSTLKAAGFTGSNLTNAFNIAKTESGGRPGALNPTAATGDYSEGLFQINMIGDLGKKRNAQYLKDYASIGYKGPQSLYDPSINAKIAYDISHGGTNWHPWQNSAIKLGLLNSSNGMGTGGTSSAASMPVSALASAASDYSTLQKAGAFNPKSNGGTNVTINLTGSADTTALAALIKKTLSDPTFKIGNN
jgi:hypothetical protein